MSVIVNFYKKKVVGFALTREEEERNPTERLNCPNSAVQAELEIENGKTPPSKKFGIFGRGMKFQNVPKLLSDL